MAPPRKPPLPAGPSPSQTPAACRSAPFANRSSLPARSLRMAAVGPSKAPLVAINDNSRARKGWQRASTMFRLGNMFKAAGQAAEERMNSLDDDSKAAAQRRKERTEARRVLRERRAAERAEREASRTPLQVCG